MHTRSVANSLAHSYKTVRDSGKALACTARGGYTTLSAHNRCSYRRSPSNLCDLTELGDLHNATEDNAAYALKLNVVIHMQYS